MTKKKDSGHGEEVLELMRQYDLFAVDTLFKLVRKVWGKRYDYDIEMQHTW